MFAGSDQQCRSLWANQAVEGHLVAGVEDFQLIITNSVSSGSIGGAASAQGFVEFTDGSVKVIGSRDSEAPDSVSRWGAMPPCGAALPGPEACFGSLHRGPTVRTLLTSTVSGLPPCLRKFSGSMSFSIL